MRPSPAMPTLATTAQPFAAFRAAVRVGPNRRLVISAANSPEGGDTDDDVSALFKKELQRRNISSVDELDQKSSSRDSARAGVSPPPFFAGTATEEVPPQLARSRALNSEGLEGLIPRATELIKLGGAFFLAFGPFIIAVALSFTAIYAVFGDSFVHSGRPSSGPPVYDPQELLAEPTVDPMVPM